MSQTVLIDDQDLSHVNYNGTWLRGGSTSEHDHTVASSSRVGDFFTVSFTGNLIVVYGTIDSTSEGVLTNYSVDGAPPAQATSQAGFGDTYNQQFWKSPTLDEGHHTLVVTMAKLNTEAGPGEGTVWFDYFSVTDPRIKPGSAARSRNIGAIVGGVVGGAAVLILISLAVLFLLRRRNKRHLNHVQPWTDKEVEINTSPVENVRRGGSSNPNIEPFPLVINSQIPNTPTTSTSSPFLRKMASQYLTPSSASATTTTTHQPPSPTVSSCISPISTTSPPSNTPDTASRKRPGGSVPTPDVLVEERSSNSLPGPAVQHVDSGVRMDSLQIPTGPVELPPVYSPI